ACLSGAYFCCQTNSDCPLPGNVGEKTCAGTPKTCGNPLICAAGYKLCSGGTTRILQNRRCSNSDCPSGLTFNSNACSLQCGTGLQPCGNTCIAVSSSVCCPQDN